MVAQKQSTHSPSQENISQNRQKTNQQETSSTSKVTLSKSKESCSEVQNVQNTKQEICEQIHNKYFNEESPAFKYRIPISNPYLRSRLANALIIDNQNESFSTIIKETLEDDRVWNRLSGLYDEFHKESVLQSQTPVAKSVAVLLSIL